MAVPIIPAPRIAVWVDMLRDANNTEFCPQTLRDLLELYRKRQEGGGKEKPERWMHRRLAVGDPPGRRSVRRQVLAKAGMERSVMTDSTERFRHCALLHSGFCWKKCELVDPPGRRCSSRASILTIVSIGAIKVCATEICKAAGRKL